MSPRALVARARYVAVRMAARLPGALQVRLSGEPQVMLDGQRLDPQLQLLRAIGRNHPQAHPAERGHRYALPPVAAAAAPQNARHGGVRA